MLTLCSKVHSLHSVEVRFLNGAGIGGGFMLGILRDHLSGRLEAHQVKRAVQLRNIMTSLGPAYIKLGQVRPLSSRRQLHGDLSDQLPAGATALRQSMCPKLARLLAGTVHSS